MKIIDLLDKMAKGEEVPKKIRVFEEEFIFEDNDYYSINSSAPLISYTGEDYLRAELNCEIEIIEEDKKIEKLNSKLISETQYKWDDITIDFLKADMSRIVNKINELIDEVNKLKGEK